MRIDYLIDQAKLLTISINNLYINTEDYRFRRKVFAKYNNDSLIFSCFVFSFPFIP